MHKHGSDLFALVRQVLLAHVANRMAQGGSLQTPQRQQHVVTVNAFVADELAVEPAFSRAAGPQMFVVVLPGACELVGNQAKQNQNGARRTDGEPAFEPYRTA